MECDRCGGSNWHIASAGFLDDLRSAFGSALYKCVRCGKRRRERVWPASQCIVAHCPRCFSQQLQVWNRAFVPPSFRRSILFAFGGEAYRCYECQYVFLSFRPRRLLARHPRPAEDRESPVGAAASETKSKGEINV
ncbi:MAG: hypothetical protein U5J83_16905 [Bryobacterales bacterium]|nr:hypothetical protein [Bryobacterales bacterium]